MEPWDFVNDYPKKKVFKCKNWNKEETQQNNNFFFNQILNFYIFYLFLISFFIPLSYSFFSFLESTAWTLSESLAFEFFLSWLISNHSQHFSIFPLLIVFLTHCIVNQAYSNIYSIFTFFSNLHHPRKNHVKAEKNEILFLVMQSSMIFFSIFKNFLRVLEGGYFIIIDNSLIFDLSIHNNFLLKVLIQEVLI